MVQKYYNTEEAAQALGVGIDKVKEMQQLRQIHGYRDGADWKFKTEDIDKLAKELFAQKKAANAAAQDDESDVLLSEIELGESDPSASGTVIGMESGGEPAAGSDVKLGDEAGSDDVDSKVSQFEELDLTLEEDLSLDDGEVAPGGSDVDLTGKQLEDDDLVLGGSGVGSGVSIGGDSGISLVDPADSGLSLEEPLELGGSSVESLELGEDDMIALTGEAEAESPTELKTDDDFLLTPLEEAGEDDDSESGSQVIALDTEGEEDAATMLGGAGGGVAAMLDEDVEGIGPLDGAAPGMTPLGTGPGAFAEGAPMTPTDAALPETPYSIWNVLGLSVCVLLLVFCGMFMYDMMRNMWSWDSPYSVSSATMDTILGWFEGQ